MFTVRPTLPTPNEVSFPVPHDNRKPQNLTLHNWNQHIFCISAQRKRAKPNVHEQFAALWQHTYRHTLGTSCHNNQRWSLTRSAALMVVCLCLCVCKYPGTAEKLRLMFYIISQCQAHSQICLSQKKHSVVLGPKTLKSTRPPKQRFRHVSVCVCPLEREMLFPSRLVFWQRENFEFMWLSFKIIKQGCCHYCF